jgi:hypothetical protein
MENDGVGEVKKDLEHSTGAVKIRSITQREAVEEPLY